MPRRNSLGVQKGDNASLLLAKYLGDSKSPEDKAKVQKWAMQAVQYCQNAQSVYAHAFNRWKNLLPSSADKAVVTTKSGRLIIGLGSDNVLESGITLQHTYGVPYIPSSALKGLSAHYCNTEWGTREPKFRKTGEYYEVIFGTNGNAGHLMFYDAWLVPAESPSLKLDVMTPHHSDYYLEKADFPSDFDSPVPVSFLSVSGSFLIAVSCDGGGDEGAKWTKLTMRLMQEALCKYGIGGKTSSGYGRLIVDAPKTAALQPVDELKEFKEWFDQNLPNHFDGFNQHHGEIIGAINKLSEDKIRSAKAYVKEKLRKPAPGLKKFLSVPQGSAQ